MNNNFNFSNELVNEVKSRILNSICDYEDSSIEDYIMDEFNSILFSESEGDEFISNYYKDFKTMLNLYEFNYGYELTSKEIQNSERMASLLVLMAVEDIMYRLYDASTFICENNINLNDFKCEEA